MIKYFRPFFLILIVLLTASCSGQDCSKINNDFESYQSALKIIKSSEFKITDNCDTSKSSWIYNADFYSCNGIKGFLIIETKSKAYIHKEVPIEKWNEFKKAKSFGKYYNQNIKNRFQLII
ncbi:KTSC domain-containing protein [Lutibacter sp. B1]|uniref:KTSC domain-containing protein n=1 Tax=Lutibacter sp. B1 TaxID=2725996 RepID=UPI001456AE41|nr:KTSC domain-containing protein [Lutibacter sp. B1]NLP59429.1 KTSC domain-containing protein [Lutibacter sp. B1]